MNNHPIKLTFTVPAHQYDQLLNLTRLLQVVHGEQPDVNQLAQKLLLHSLTHFALPENAAPANLPVPVVPMPAVKNNEQPAQNETTSSQVADYLAGLAKLNKHDRTPLNLPPNWLACTGQLAQGVSIGILAPDTETATQYALQLANQLCKTLPVAYIAPEHSGSFREMLNTYQIKSTVTYQRVSAYHYVPENKTQWKDLALTHRNNLLYKVICIDNASEIGIDPLVYQGEFQRLTLRAKQPVTGIFALCEEPFSPAYENWLERLDVVVQANENGLWLLKNTVTNDFENNPDNE
jgi:hypothetical protein